MAILQRHIPYYREIFALPGFFSEPMLVFGFPEIRIHPLYYRSWGELNARDKWRKLSRSLRRRRDAARGATHPDLQVPEEFRAPDLLTLLRQRGLQQVAVLDHFDDRATLDYDMNLPVPDREHDRYGTLLDIGCLEHVFDTRQCLENCLRMVREGGTYFLHTVINGYLRHGLHVFNPEGLLGALTLNGFEIVYLKYSTASGAPLQDPAQARDAIVWIVARKLRGFKRFESPQQGQWREIYARSSNGR